MVKIKDAIPLELGIFQQMAQGPTPVLWADRYDADDMDLEFLTKFGNRTAAPLVTYFLKEDGQVDEAGMARMAKMIHNKFKENWSRRYEVLTAQYGLLDNYNMIEEESTDRASLETSIRELLRNNLAAGTQINDLIEAITNNNLNTARMTGTNATADSSVNNINSTVNELGGGTTTQNDTDTLKFVDRTDTETRNLSKTGSVDSTDTEDKTNALTFLNREDVETRDLTKTTDGQRVDNDARTDALTFVDRKDSTVGTSNETTDVTEDNGSTETNVGSKDTDTKRNVFGYNATAIAPAPAESSEGLEGSTNTVDINALNESTTTATGTKTDDTTKTGAEINTKGGTLTVTDDVDERDTGTVRSGKTGTETNATGGTVHTVGTTGETDTGTLTNSKLGQEINTKVATGSNTTNNEATTIATNTGTGDTTTTYDTTNTTTDAGDLNKLNTGTVTNTTTLDESENANDQTTGQVNETRGLTRKGNIGVTTSQQLLHQHLEFWRYSFLDDVYNDVIGMIGLAIYSDE